MLKDICHKVVQSKQQIIKQPRESLPIICIIWSLLACNYCDSDQYYLSMTEQELASDFNDQKMMTTQGQESQFKLPKIDTHATRPQVRSKAQKRRNSPVLPNLKKSTQSNYQTSQDMPSKKSIVADRQRDDFAMEIEERLKLVLETVKQGENVEERSEEQEEEMEFQDAILHNKERIKQFKLNNEGKMQRKPQSRQDRHANANRQKNMKSLGKQDMLYEKRIKEMSVQNKFLQKKKEIIAQKNQAIERAKQLAKEREQSKPGNGIPFPVRYAGRNKQSPKKSPQKPPPKEESPVSSNNLFDNIHNFLQNPLKNRVKSTVNTHQSIKLLQSKLKHLNERLGVSQTIQLKKQDIGIVNYTALDWKRFVYGESTSLKCYQDSNFEKQIDKVNRLQQKNDAFLGEYLDHQRRLVQLTLIKKGEGKSHRLTS